MLDETTEKMRKALVLRDETEKELSKTRDVVATLKAELATKSAVFDPRDVELDSMHAENVELKADLQRCRDEMSRMNAEVASLRHLKAAATSSPSPGGGTASRAEVDELRARVSVLRYGPFMDPPIRDHRLIGIGQLGFIHSIRFDSSVRFNSIQFNSIRIIWWMVVHLAPQNLKSWTLDPHLSSCFTGRERRQPNPEALNPNPSTIASFTGRVSSTRSVSAKSCEPSSHP